MARKRYPFDKILKEYNEIHGCDYKLPLDISKATIIYVTETTACYVTYLNEDGSKSAEQPLTSFIYYNLSESIRPADILGIVLSEETKKLTLKIEVWPPSKIRYAYLCTNYAMKDVGILGKSCMRSKDMQKSLNFYAKNNVRIVVVVGSKGKIHARALLWKDVKTTRNKKVFTYLDRVYTNSNSLVSLYDVLVEKHKWVQYKTTSPGNADASLYVDNLDIKGMYHLPYTDTFKWLYYKDSIVCSYSLPSGVKHKNDKVSLTTVGNGGYFPDLDPNRVREAFTGSYISKKDATFVKRYKNSYDGYVLKTNIVDINGAYYSKADKELIETAIDGYILKKDSVSEVITGNMISKSKAIYSLKYKGSIHKSNAVNIKDEVYHKSDTNITCFRDKWYHISECFVNYDREKKNQELEKRQYKFWIPPNEYFLPDFIPYPDAAVTLEKDLIPKEHAIIAYNLIYNPLLRDIEYQVVYYPNTNSLIQLTTGELIVNSVKNKKYLKKFNNKWRIKQTIYKLKKAACTCQTSNPNCLCFSSTDKLKCEKENLSYWLPDKKQLQFAFMCKEK